METINDVLYFLNQMEINNILPGVELSTFNIDRKTLIDEFENINLVKLVEVLYKPSMIFI